VNGPDVATHPATRIDQLRRQGVHRAVGLLVEGDPMTAYHRLAASVEAQALLAECGHVTIPRPEILPDLQEVPD